ncbi:MAG: NYN domain-containing protein [Alicyclobacillus sp.]|nr:NYN domain-containing protein [Alicyclobacillus sp.]
MHADVAVKHVPMSQSQREKGIDVAMAVDAMEIGLNHMIDICALVTGDGDFVPLVRSLMKHGIRVMTVFFDYE